MKRLCVYGTKYAHSFLYLCRIYTGRQVFNKNNTKYCVKVPKQYNMIGKNLVLLFNMEKTEKPNLK